MQAPDMPEEQWLLCPVCRNKTRIKLKRETVLRNFLLFCPKCRIEAMINVEEFNTQVIKEPDATRQIVLKTQSR